MPDAPALRTCPFCGGEAEIVTYPDQTRAGCYNNGTCDVRPKAITARRADAIARWNRRANQEGGKS